MSDIAVTGCNGFVGGHLVEALLALGHSVTGIDHRPCTTVLPSKFVQIELAETVSIDAVARAIEGCQAVIHLASRQPFSWDLQPLIRGNIFRTANALEAINRASVSRVIHASTIAVYGRPASVPLLEDSPRQPENAYEVSKAHAEDLVGLYARTLDLRATILRYPSIYGGRFRAGAMFTFVDATLRRSAIRLFAKGSTLRDHLHVQDVVRANIAALGHEPAAAIEIFNIGSGQALSNRALCDLIADVIGHATTIELADDPNWRGEDLALDVSRARRNLQFVASPLRDGIVELVTSLRKERA
jgi:UDP-glucose 4-epimerase